MFKKALILLFMTLPVPVSFATEKQVNRIPIVTRDYLQENLYSYERGFWVSAEGMGGYSCHLSGHNMGLAEIDITAGYRFDEFIKVGVGIGMRYYFDQKDLRRHSSPLGMPLFVAARGNMIRGKYRKTVPYWGFDFGGSFPDGIMFRPTVGLHIGDPRSAFIIGLSYMGQNIAVADDIARKTNRYTGFACLRLGYEF